MQDTKLGFVVQALSTIAHALRALYLNECSSLPELATSSSYSYSSSVDVDRDEDARPAAQVSAEHRESAADSRARTRRRTTTDTAVEVGQDYEGTRENGEEKENENERAEKGRRVKRQSSAAASGEESQRRRRAGDCPSIVNLSGPRLFSYLMSVNFTLPSRQPIFFDASGDPPARCSLNFFRCLYLYIILE